jgi:hypothetical protein
MSGRSGGSPVHCTKERSFPLFGIDTRPEWAGQGQLCRGAMLQPLNATQTAPVRNGG